VATARSAPVATDQDLDRDGRDNAALSQRLAHIRELWQQLQATRPRSPLHAELTAQIRREADAYMAALKRG
jgi:uncharacterized membrane protein